jgi:dihydroneopterin aldolase
MKDYIIASKIEVFCKIGCTEAERAFPQRLLVSLRFTTSTRAAAVSGDLSQTVDYAVACARVKEITSAKAWVLLEELAETYAEHLLREFQQASAVNIVIEPKFGSCGSENGASTQNHCGF